MFLISPRDVLNILKATGIYLENKEIRDYTNIFKYVFGCRRWLRHMVDEGYQFTIGSPRLRELIHPIPRNLCKNTQERFPQDQIRQKLYLDLLLIVSKNGSLVDGNAALLPNHVFSSSWTGMTITSQRDTDLFGRRTRQIQIENEDTQLCIDIVQSLHPCDIKIDTPNGILIQSPLDELLDVSSLVWYAQATRESYIPLQAAQSKSYTERKVSYVRLDSLTNAIMSLCKTLKYK